MLLARQTRRTAQLLCVHYGSTLRTSMTASTATLADVVTHYNSVRKLGLTAQQQRDLVEYLKSL
jgi:hypothetical protein